MPARWRSGALFFLAITPLPALGSCTEQPEREGKVSVGEAVADAGTGVPPALEDAGSSDADAPRPVASRLPPADLEIALAYGQSGTLRIEASAELGQLDVVFNVDTTGSMGDEIDLLQLELLTVIIPALRKRVDDVAMGVSRFEDFPIRPFGGRTETRLDEPFRLLSQVTRDETAIARAIRDLDDPLGYGGDGPEASGEALYQLATGDGFGNAGTTYIEKFEPAAKSLGDRGGAGFRARALPVIVLITDAPSHSAADYAVAFDGVHGLNDAADALNTLGARVITVFSGDASLTQGLQNLSIRTGAFVMDGGSGRCAFGVDGAWVAADDEGRCPLLFLTNEQGSGLSSRVVDSIISLLDDLRFNQVRAEVSPDPGGFVERLTAVAVRQGDGRAPEIEDRLPADEPDGDPDTFTGVYARAKVGFDIHLKNRHVRALDQEQTFRLRVQVLGDDLVLEERIVRVVVPAEEQSPPAPSDAGTAPDAGLASALDAASGA